MDTPVYNETTSVIKAAQNIVFEEKFGTSHFFLVNIKGNEPQFFKYIEVLRKNRRFLADELEYLFRMDESRYNRDTHILRKYIQQDMNLYVHALQEFMGSEPRAFIQFQGGYVDYFEEWIDKAGRWYFAAKENNESLSPEQIGSIYVCCLYRLKEELADIEQFLKPTEPRPKEVKTDEEKPLVFEEQYDIVLFFKYSGMYDALYEKTNNNSSSASRIVARLAGCPEKWNSLRPLFSHAGKYDPTNKDSKKLFNKESLDRVIDMLEEEKIDASKLRQIRAKIKD